LVQDLFYRGTPVNINSVSSLIFDAFAVVFAKQNGRKEFISQKYTLLFEWQNTPERN